MDVTKIYSSTWKDLKKTYDEKYNFNFGEFRGDVYIYSYGGKDQFIISIDNDGKYEGTVHMSSLNPCLDNSIICDAAKEAIKYGGTKIILAMDDVYEPEIRKAGFKETSRGDNYRVFSINKTTMESVMSAGSPIVDYTGTTSPSRITVEYSNCKTPDALYNWIHSNIKYDHSSKFRSYQQVLSELKGDCHDQSELEVHWFKNNGYSYKRMFVIEYNGETSKGGMTHTLVVFKNKNNGRLYWFENAWDDQSGIHGPYRNYLEIKSDIRSMWKFSNGCDKLQIQLMNKDPKPGMNLQEYVDTCLG